MTVRHCGLRHASCAIPPDTLRRMIWQVQPIDGKPMRIVLPQPRVALCPTCGAPMRVVMRLWTSQRALVDTSEAGELCHDDPGLALMVKTRAPVRLQHGIRQ